MSAPLLPTTDLVAVGWAKRNAKFTAKNVGFATRLPSDLVALQNGFGVASIVGGNPLIDIPVRQPVVQFACYAASADGSTKVPWGQASQIAEWLWEQTHSPADRNVTINIVTPPGYAPARLMTAYAITEPRRVEGDQGNLARVDIEIQLNWTGT